ncbi:hypothetical protein NUW54_g3970 [Trametes sanguinea]|uniref:Uncharacterized protein n=1 Tax=Trametes sanguinea TaxID=158606 RepID=A0ACC1Q218_9APHY|nr:hypothetical protein NUW54_g3970 [Trametes sanguinea]
MPQPSSNTSHSTGNGHRSPGTDRPVTSKPRGICKYYNTDRGCYAGNSCKFLHGEAERLTPYDKTKVCRFYAAGYCRRGESCWFLHTDPAKVASGSQPKACPQEDEEECAICYDKPVTYGLLAGCSHVFCLSCIKNWRENEGKEEDVIRSGMTKTCPMCRTPSRFVTPSTHFYPEGHPMKAEVVEKYKASMARVKCRHFEKSKANKKLFCPFGKDCFYKHETADGTLYVFEHGASHYMNRMPSRRRLDDVGFDVGDADSDTELEMMLSTISHVFGGSQDLRTALRAVASAFAADFRPLPYEDPETIYEDSDEDNVFEVLATSRSLASNDDSSTTGDSQPVLGINVEDEVVIAPDHVPEADSSNAEPTLAEGDALTPAITPRPATRSNNSGIRTILPAQSGFTAPSRLSFLPA